MKRSEAYARMRANIKLNPAIYCAAMRFQRAEISWGKLTEIIADHALYTAEELIGMKPPAQTLYQVTDLECNKFGELEDVFTWSKEDE